ncbi:pentapeptide MXKDX repeat protein [Burkholderia sp. Ac-20365]|uniref:pentapeptide MXKDX repeat protein n=1 Tax=Burkholderia sp. Ac-20365 TaxID=2703897 RepID=UPI00197BA8AA|nr:pentapeptide MXKDX repeat protein [Burkholderia sp. Ac-20365]MBN3759272.1 pentapeptide MXKDX repeat protein [Burkholderia sp. Ac-20365]
MKRVMPAVFAITLTISTSAAFAQASGAMANNAMSHDAMGKSNTSRDAMGKGSMAHSSMKKGEKIKKDGAMGMSRPAPAQ